MFTDEELFQEWFINIINTKLSRESRLSVILPMSDSQVRSVEDWSNRMRKGRK
jgi:hypothetical protein